MSIGELYGDFGVKPLVKTIVVLWLKFLIPKIIQDIYLIGLTVMNAHDVVIRS